MEIVSTGTPVSYPSFFSIPRGIEGWLAFGKRWLKQPTCILFIHTKLLVSIATDLLRLKDVWCS